MGEPEKRGKRLRNALAGSITAVREAGNLALRLKRADVGGQRNIGTTAQQAAVARRLSAGFLCLGNRDEGSSPASAGERVMRIADAW